MHYELELLRKDGSWIWGQINVTAHIDQNGEIIGAHGTTHDISKRKRAEELLKQSETQYRLLADHMKDQVWLMDMNLKPTYISPSIEKLRGYTLEEIVKLPLDKQITPASLQVAVEFYSTEMVKALADPTYDLTRTLEMEYYRKDGSTVWMEDKFTIIRDENGKPLSILGEGRDITEQKKSVGRTKKSLESIIQALAMTVETRDPYTAGHQRRVADLARAIATEMNLPADQIEGIWMASVIHDLGKIVIPAEILSKPTKLTELEFSLIKTHSQSGHDILKDIEFPWPIARIILEHHERLNGSGYPNGLKGEEILLGSRILAVADVVEAMASYRPYRPALGIEVALEEIVKNKGIFYDNTVADACLRLFREKCFQLER